MPGKISPHRLAKKEREALDRELRSTLTAVKDAGFFERFVCELLKPSEILMAARRILIAKRLLQGHGFLQIRRELGAGQENIEAIDRWLRRDCEEYRRIVQNVHRPLSEGRTSLGWTEKRCPFHFLLLKLIRSEKTGM